MSQQIAAPGAAGTRRAIAVDGLSGSGKSTVSRRVATRLGWSYLDTGACYRALTVAALAEGAVEPGAARAAVPLGPVAERALRTLDLSTDPRSLDVRLGGVDVTAEIRSPRTTSTVSAVAADPDLRAAAVRWQRAQVESATGCVVEGRDIGTVVLPGARLKVWLTASAARRAERRADETATAATAARTAIDRRDRLDSERLSDPARPAVDAVVVDTDELDADGVVAQVLALAAQRGLVPA